MFHLSRKYDDVKPDGVEQLKPAAVLTRRRFQRAGPSFLVCSVISVAISANRGPWADDRLYICTRSGSMSISVERPLHIFHFPTGFEISFQEMTFTLQSAGHVDGIGAVLDGPQQVQDVHPAGTGTCTTLTFGGYVEAHGPGQVSGGRKRSTCSKKPQFEVRKLRSWQFPLPVASIK
jgi:hypothetical protein